MYKRSLGTNKSNSLLGIILIIPFYLLFNSFTGVNRNELHREFEKNMAVKKKNIQINNREIKLGKVNAAIVFLEQITKIESESDAEFFGRFHPTVNDYNRWNKWYEINKTKLVWDKETKKIKLLD